MGTRSLTFVHEDGIGSPVLVAVYQQYDGYFSGVGDDILSFLKGKTVVNGIGGGDTSRQFNGAGDLAMRLITHFKGGDEDNIGGAYVMAPDLSDGDAGAEFAYHIYTEGASIRLVARDLYAKYNVSGSVDTFTWPETDADGNYVDENSPLTDDQRSALFATFGEVFADSDQDKRLAFTGMVLNKDPRAVAISWSRHKPGALTYGEASQVLDALNVLNV